jgi:flotillin
VRLLGSDTAQIVKQAEDIIFGQLRQVIASMAIQEINRERDVFLEKVQTALEPELKKIGLVLINVNIRDIKDESGFIEAIGRKAASSGARSAWPRPSASAPSTWPMPRRCATSAPRRPSASAP